MKKKPLLITCALLLAAVPTVLVEGKNGLQCSYVTKVRSAAKSVSTFTQTLLVDTNAGLLDYTYSDGLCFHAEEPLHDGIYRAEYDPKAGTLTYRTAEGETAVTADWKSFSENKLFFIIDIREGSAMQVCACRSNTLTEADLVPAGRGVKEWGPPIELTLAGYWLDRYIGYLNYDYTPQSAETA